MVNALGVLGWGVGGIEAEAAMLGQPVAMVIPEVIGFRLQGQAEGGRHRHRSRADLSRRCCASAAWSRKFVEYYGHGLDHLSVEDRATIANMAPEYGATCGFFPDRWRYHQIPRPRTQPRARRPGRGLLQGAGPVARGRGRSPVFTDVLELDLDTVGALARRTKAARRTGSPLARAKSDFAQALARHRQGCRPQAARRGRRGWLRPWPRRCRDRRHHLAAPTPPIRPCWWRPDCWRATPRQKGLRPAAWVKTSLAPGSQVVTDYLAKAGLQDDLDALWGSTWQATAAPPASATSVRCRRTFRRPSTQGDLVGRPRCLSGNRNFEGRVNADVKANYLGLAAAGRRLCAGRHAQSSISPTEPLGTGSDGNPSI